MPSRGLRASLAADFCAGFATFLIALPLSMGIAIASGVPATAGILAAMVGGMVGAWAPSAPLTILGPAAGMIVVVLGAVQELGGGSSGSSGYEAVLGCTVIAGVLQVLLGLFRVGRFGALVPPGVIHGMMSAIGCIIISKQVHVALGVSGVPGGPLLQVMAWPASFARLNLGIAAISALALVLAVAWARMPAALGRWVPAPLVAVVGGVLLGEILDLHHVHDLTMLGQRFGLGPEYLLDVPQTFAAALQFPSFAAIDSLLFWKHTLILASVASIESTLTVCAIDKIDPLRRKSDLDRDLVGKGLCNVVSGSVGGLPIIAEVLRSAANVANGAKSQLSNFFHGVFLAAFLVLAPNLLHEIPLAALAAVLCLVGWRLAAPTHWLAAFRTNVSEGIVFVTTLIVILASDLLVGVLVGSITHGILSLGMRWRERSSGGRRVHGFD